MTNTFINRANLYSYIKITNKDSLMFIPLVYLSKATAKPLYTFTTCQLQSD